MAKNCKMEKNGTNGKKINKKWQRQHKWYKWQRWYKWHDWHNGKKRHQLQKWKEIMAKMATNGKKWQMTKKGVHSQKW